MSHPSADLPAIDRSHLNACVRRAIGHDQAEIVDWQAALIGGSLVFFELSPAAVQDVSSQALAQYVVGLQGSANLEQARLAYITTLALRYGLGSALDISIVADNSLHEWAEQVLGHTVAELSVNTSANLEFFLACAREAGAFIGE